MAWPALARAQGRPVGAGGRPAARAEAAQLDRLLLDEKAEFGGAAQHGGNGGVVELGGGAAAAADEELAHMRPFRPRAADIGVERFDAVDEAVLDEKIERAVDRGRRGAGMRAAQRLEHGVSADRLVTRQTSCSTWRRSSVSRAPRSAQSCAARSSASSTHLSWSWLWVWNGITAAGEWAIASPPGDERVIV